jgi:hypothetical protein
VREDNLERTFLGDLGAVLTYRSLSTGLWKVNTDIVAGESESPLAFPSSSGPCDVTGYQASREIESYLA